MHERAGNSYESSSSRGEDKAMNQAHHHPTKETVADLNLSEQSEEQLIERGLSGDAVACPRFFRFESLCHGADRIN